MPTDPHLEVSEAVRVQILATEHWSLLATRNITYGAIYSRASIFLTVVSAAVVALALAAEATEFGDRFYVFALLVLPVAFFIGVGTYIRLGDARIEALIRQFAAYGPQEEADAIFGSLRSFRGRVLPDDDVSVAIIRRT